MNTQDRALLAISIYSDSGYLSDAFEKAGISRTEFYKVKKQYPRIADEYARARETKADHFADRVSRIVDEELDPQRARMQVDGLKWLASVFNRREYGDKLDMNVAGTVDLNAALTLAQQRHLRHSGDSARIEDAQVIETLTLPAPCATDKESEANSDVCDPFED